MNKDIVKTLVVLALVVVGMAASIAFFTRPKDTGAPVVENNPVSEPVVQKNLTEGSFEYEGAVSLVSADTLSIMTSEGEIRVSTDRAEIADESGTPASLAYLSRGVRVSVKGESGEASDIRVISSPDVVIFSPAANAPVGLIFRVDGSARTGRGDVAVKLKNRRTGSVYLEGAIKVPSAIGRYGNFALPVNLSSALDILDGDMLDAEFTEGAGSEKASSSWRYSGGSTSKIKVFFFKKGQCGSVASVDRLIDASKSAVRSGIEEAIKGPSALEVAEGYVTALPSTTKIRSLELREGIVYIDFTSTVLAKGPACDISSERKQIVDTIMQFPTIKQVIISVDGEEKNAFNR